MSPISMNDRSLGLGRSKLGSAWRALISRVATAALCEYPNTRACVPVGSPMMALFRMSSPSATD